jgi:hypothetical protein
MRTLFVTLKKIKMEATQLRINFHQLIDSIDNERILSKFYGLMSKSRESTDGKLWSRLTSEEQDELLLSDIESDNPDNIISHTVIQKKHSKWL